MSTPAISSLAARLDEVSAISIAMGLSYASASRLLRTMEQSAPLSVSLTPATLLPVIVRRHAGCTGAVEVVL